MYPSSQRRSGSWPFFWPCCLAPSPGGLVCFGGLAVILFTWAFHVLVFRAWGLASSSSGSRTFRYGLRVYVQGASDSLPHSSPGREVVASVFGIAVRALLQTTSLPLWHGCLPGARSEFVRLYLLRIASLSLRFSCSEVPGPPVLLSSYAVCVISCGPGVLSSFVTIPGLSLWFFRT